MEGYIRLHRKIIDNPIFRKPLVNHLFVYCLLRANHTSSKMVFNCREVDVERGSFICGRKKFAEKTGESEQNVRSALLTLQNLGMIEISTTKSTSRYSYINVCNYNDYQYNGDEGNQETNQIATSKQPGSNQQATTSNNVLNNINAITVKNPPKSPQGELDVPEWLDVKVWNDFLDHRKEMKKKMSVKAMKLMIKKLGNAKSDGHNPNVLLEESICNGWQGVFPGKSKAILKPIPPEQNRTAAEPVLGGGTVHVFKVELANCNAEAAEKLWEGKPEWFRNHPRIQKLYNNKLKEREGMAQ